MNPQTPPNQPQEPPPPGVSLANNNPYPQTQQPGVNHPPPANSTIINQTITQSNSAAGTGKKTNGLSIAGFILSLLCGLFFIVPILNLFLPALAVTLSAIGLNHAQKNDETKGLAIAGLVIGILILIAALIYTIAILGLIGAGAATVEDDKSSLLL